MPSDKIRHSLKRSRLPISVFVTVFGLHFVWLGLFPEGGTSIGQWAMPEAMPAPRWWESYIESQSYFIGFSYSLSLAFAAWALRHYREERLCASRTLAVCGISFSGFLAVVGCYLLACCGSPMLIVYLNLFGTAFLPFAKSFVALFTLASVTVAAWWLIRRPLAAGCGPSSDQVCGDPDQKNAKKEVAK